MIRSKAITQAARDEICTMGSPECVGDPARSAWRHSNELEHGKGVGHKAHDLLGFIGCDGCEHWYTFTARQDPEREIYFYRACFRSLIRLVDKGIVIIK